jgi:hypothetical protein
MLVLKSPQLSNITNPGYIPRENIYIIIIVFADIELAINNEMAGAAHKSSHQC